MTVDEIAATNRRVWEGALPALRALNQRGIPVIVLKSLPHIEELYGAAGGRLTLDVDLFVHAADVETAFEALLTAGYRPKTGEHYPSLDDLSRRAGRFAALRERKWTLVPAGDPDGFDLDLHNDGIAPWRSPALRPSVWATARRQERDGVHFLTLGPEDRLIFLCAAVAAEGFRRRKTADVARVLALSEVDWERVQAESRRLGVSLQVVLVCQLARAWNPDAGPAPSAGTLPFPEQVRYALLYPFLVRLAHLLRGPAIQSAAVVSSDRPAGAWFPALRTYLLRRIPG